MANLKLIGLILLISVNISFAQKEMLTPLEQSRFTRLSSHADVMIYLESLQKESSMLAISVIGKSVEGREIPLLHFSQKDETASKETNKLKVFIICQQHGSEPAGKEAALIIARKLIREYTFLLDKFDIYLIPLVNPDGAEINQRKNANNVDLNMNYVRLDQPESRAVHDAFLEIKPEITIDVHEYDAVRKEWVSNGVIRDADIMLDGPTNLNIAKDIIQFSQKKIIPESGKKIENEGYKFHRLVFGTPFKGDRMRYSSSTIRDGRQSFGIYNTFSFVLEGKRYADVLSNIKRRVESQVSALEAFLNTITEYDSEIKDIINNSRKHILEPADQSRNLIHLQMDYFPDPDYQAVYFPLFDLYKWAPVNRKVKNLSPIIKPKKSVVLPQAYIFESNQEGLISLLNKHRIQMKTYKSDTLLMVEVYEVLHDVPAIEEGKSSRNIDVLVREEKKKITPRHKIVFLNQPAGVLIPLLLEPQSSWGILSTNSGLRKKFKKYAQLNSDYPIWRLSTKSDLKSDLLISDN